MAIASVARTATIRRDNTLFKTNQLLSQQKAVAKKLELQQQEIAAKREDAKAKRNRELLKEFNTIEGGNIPQWQKNTEKITNRLATGLLDANKSEADKEALVIQGFNRAKIVEAAEASVKNVHKALVGTEQQRKERDEDEITRIESEYLDETDAKDYSETELQNRIENSLSSYHTDVTSATWLETVEEQVARSTSTKSIDGGLFTQVDQKKQSAKFLVLNESNTGFAVGNDGRPSIVISGESLKSYEKFSKGHKLEIDQYIADNTVESTGLVSSGVFPSREKTTTTAPTRLEAMEGVLREKGAFNIDEETTTVVKTTPTPSATDPARKAKEKAKALEVRVSFITGKDTNLIGNLKGQTGVVSSGQRVDSSGNNIGDPETTKAAPKTIDGQKGTEYTIVTDLRKLQKTSPEAIMVDIDGDGKETPVATITGTAPIIEVRKIFVSDKDKEAGYIELNDYFNRSVPAAQRIGADTFINALRGKKEEAPEVEEVSAARQAMIDKLEAIKNQKNP